MSEKLQNKYRIPSARAPWWDYGNPGIYFITICTHGRDRIFGAITNGRMNLSTIGKITDEEWHKSFEIRAEFFCDSFVIMPNHIHAILRIEPQRSPKSISSFVAGFKSAATAQLHHCTTAPLWVC